MSGYSNKADIWSLGCIIYELVTGSKAFPGDYAVLQYVMSSKAPAGLLANSGLLSHFFTKELLVLDPLRRPSAKRLKILLGIAKYMLLNFEISLHLQGDALRKAVALSSRLGHQEAVAALFEDLLDDASNDPNQTGLYDSLLCTAVQFRNAALIKLLLKTGVGVFSPLFDLSYS